MSPRARKAGTILIAGICAVLLTLQVLATLQKSTIGVECDMTIQSPAGEVFAVMDRIANAKYWLPWAQLDPQATFTFTGPESGQGATCHWQGDDRLGKGSITIVRSEGDEHRGQIQLSHDYTHRRIRWTFMRIDIAAMDETSSRVRVLMIGHRGFWACVLANFQDQRAAYRLLVEQGMTKLAQRVASSSTVEKPPTDDKQGSFILPPQRGARR